jgi:hypothetical protein
VASERHCGDARYRNSAPRYCDSVTFYEKITVTKLKTIATHENFSRLEEVRLSSDRTFGLVFVAVFLVVALLPLFGGRGARYWALGVSGVILLTALVYPPILHPLNLLWARLGLLLSRIVNPVVTAVLFYGVFTPVGLIGRLFGKDPLLLRTKAQDTYWIHRVPPGPPPETMSNQF